MTFVTKESDNIEHNIAVYEEADGKLSFNVNIFADTVWLTQKQLAKLFQKTIPTINEHIKNCYEEGEVQKSSTIRKFLIVQNEGKREVVREVEHYSRPSKTGLKVVI